MEKDQGGMIVGIEVGGTFTDLVALGEGQPRILKVPSVPARPDEGVLAAIKAAGIRLEAVTEIVHGSTVATNAVLERRGAKVAFITTRGFRDLLLLQRHNRTNIYDLAYRKPEPLTNRRDCYEVIERTGGDGAVIVQLDLPDIRQRLIPLLRSGAYNAAAICLINSYTNPTHEQDLARLLSEEIPDLLITLSSETSREFREYERASTTVLSAYVQPVIDAYLGRLQHTLDSAGFRGRFSVMQSNGGRVPATGMRRQAASALLSGPSAGVVGAARQAARSGLKDLITFDMGGTSTDVCLVEGGRPEIASGLEVEGLPIRIPAVNMHTVGAGGGSIVWVDDGGMIRVGPRSAGADPGPACYGRGGELPTITDAHVICGTIRPAAFLGGRMTIDRARSLHVFEPVARRIGLSIEETAESAIRIAIASIARAIQHVSTNRGKDPRSFTLLAYGGAGPLHAAYVADELGMNTVLIPPRPGVLSAFGLLASDVVHLESKTRRIRVDEEAPSALQEAWGEMRERARRRLSSLGFESAADFELWLDMRFVGQAFEVSVPVSASDLDRIHANTLRARFDAEHRCIFGHGGSQRPIEIVALRVAATLPNPAIPSLAASERKAMQAAHTQKVFTAGSWQTWRAIDSDGLETGQPLDGPMIVEDWTSTIILPSGWRAARDASGNLILNRE